MANTQAGYSWLSILVHWLGAVSIVALFVTHEGPRDSFAFQFHVAGGALIGLFLIWRVSRRAVRGFPPKPDQHPLFNLASTVVIWGLLTCIIVLVITGYLLPWSVGQPIDMAGLFDIPSPFPASRAFHEIMEEAHDIAGHLIVPLALLHVLGAFKHLIWDRDGIMQRMLMGRNGGA